MRYTGLFDRAPFPERLRGHVVSPEADPRIHGYAVQSDLAQHTSFVAIGWLALTGELPSPAERAALEYALACLAPLHVGEGPVHAAVLARISGGPDHVLPGVAAVALGQHAANEIRMTGALFAWLDGRGRPPAEAIVPDPDAAALARHDAAVAASADWFERPLPARPVLTRVATAYALLHHLGIIDGLRLQAFAAWARLPAVLAEAGYARAGGVNTYPARLPAYEYMEER